MCVCVCVLLTKSAGAFPLQLGFYQLTLTWAWPFKPHTAHFNIPESLLGSSASFQPSPSHVMEAKFKVLVEASHYL